MTTTIVDTTDPVMVDKYSLPIFTVFEYKDVTKQVSFDRRKYMTIGFQNVIDLKSKKIFGIENFEIYEHMLRECEIIVK